MKIMMTCVGITLSYLAYQLAKDPAIQQRLQQEIDEAYEAAGGRMPDYNVIQVKIIFRFCFCCLKKNKIDILTDKLCLHCTKKSDSCIPRNETACEASLPIPTIMYLLSTYVFPGSVHIFSCSKIGRPILEIYKSLTDT
jgi:hypothetical protein